MATRKKIKLTRVTSEPRRKIKIRRSLKQSKSDGENEKPDSRTRKFRKAMSAKRFMVEHVIGLRMLTYVQMPATGLYEPECLEAFSEEIKHCHIYMVGTLPLVISMGAKQDGDGIAAKFYSGGKTHRVRLAMPDDTSFVDDGGGAWHLENRDRPGWKGYPNRGPTLSALRHKGMKYDLNVLYVGKAFGKNGRRHAVDRLLKHEKLLEIAVKGAPSGYELVVLLLRISPTTDLMTILNGLAQDDSEDRIDKGVQAVLKTTEAQRTSIFEAALIRYFAPPYNKQLKKKGAFPSKKNPQLEACYKKDIAAVSAELDFSNAPFGLFTNKIQPSQVHIASFDLHKEKDRKVFFLETVID